MLHAAGKVVVEGEMGDLKNCSKLEISWSLIVLVWGRGSVNRRADKPSRHLISSCHSIVILQTVKPPFAPQTMISSNTLTSQDSKRQLYIHLKKWFVPHHTLSRRTLTNTSTGAHTSSNLKRTPRLYPRCPHIRRRHDWLCAHWIRSQYRRWSHCWRPRMVHATRSATRTNKWHSMASAGTASQTDKPTVSNSRFSRRLCWREAVCRERSGRGSRYLGH